VKIIEGRTERARDRILLYGVEGIGKSTWATKADTPLFADVEQGLEEIGPPRVPIDRFMRSEKPIIEWPAGASPVSMQEFIRDFPMGEYRTSVIDTADALNLLMMASLCRRKGWKGGIEDPGFGKGWTALKEMWNELLVALRALNARGVEIILLAHTEIKNFSNPVGPDYSRFRPKINDKIVDKVKEWATAVLFAQHEEVVEGARDIVKDHGKGVGTGRRIVYTQHTPAYDAKNRYNLKPILDLDYTGFADGRAAFWASKKTGGPVQGSPPAAPVPCSSPGSAGTPAPTQEEPPMGGGGSSGPLTSHDVGLVLGEAQKVLGITNVADTKQRFMEPMGVKMLAKAEQGQLAGIVELVAAAYMSEKKPEGDLLAAARTRAKGLLA